MEWFKCIKDFNEEADRLWNYDGSVLINLEAWKKKDELESHLENTYPDLSAGLRKGKKKHITRFTR